MSTPRPFNCSSWLVAVVVGGPSQNERARPEGSIKENRLWLCLEIFLNRVERGVFKHDNVIHRVAAHSLGQNARKNEAGLLCVYVCLEERDREGLLSQLQASAQQKAFQKHIHPVFAAAHTDTVSKAVKTPSPCLCQHNMLAQKKSVSACSKNDTSFG